MKIYHSSIVLIVQNYTSNHKMYIKFFGSKTVKFKKREIIVRGKFNQEHQHQKGYKKHSVTANTCETEF